MSPPLHPHSAWSYAFEQSRTSWTLRGTNFPEEIAKIDSTISTMLNALSKKISIYCEWLVFMKTVAFVWLSMWDIRSGYLHSGSRWQNKIKKAWWQHTMVKIMRVIWPHFFSIRSVFYMPSSNPTLMSDFATRWLTLLWLSGFNPNTCYTHAPSPENKDKAPSVVMETERKKIDSHGKLICFFCALFFETFSNMKCSAVTEMSRNVTD